MLFTGRVSGLHIHSRGGTVMNKSQIKGQAEKAKGKVKEMVGKAVGNKELERKGVVENATGKIRKAYGDLKSDVKKSTK
jgi:uncharacterized protein YjbJ (UPF0337 family)